LIRINYITGFPDFFESPFRSSMLNKAMKKELFVPEFFDLKNYSVSKHKNIDDEPFAGKPGMLLKPEPFFRAMDEIENRFQKHTVIYCGPEGKPFTQDLASSLSKKECITFLCGHFKGIDQRVKDKYVTEYISVGDFIITGGELASLIITDAIVRLIPGVLNDIKSAKTDSFEDGLLDCDYFTRPDSYRNLSVHDILLSGNHAEIEKWKFQQRLNKTKTFRPDLYESYMGSKKNKD
jgi:tRNA (guanine37-N1)-methyltransferase